MADSDVRVSSRDATPKATPQVDTSVEPKTPPNETVESMEELSPMRTHEMSGHDRSVADRLCHLVDESDEEDGHEEKDVNHEKLKRKELRRQKTHDKPNRLRDRLKRTVSKAAE